MRGGAPGGSPSCAITARPGNAGSGGRTMTPCSSTQTPLGTFNCPAHRGVQKAKVGEAGLWQDGGRAVAATQQLLNGFDASVECEKVTCLYHTTNWWLEELVASSAPLPAEAPAKDMGDAFL